MHLLQPLTLFMKLLVTENHLARYYEPSKSIPDVECDPAVTLNPYEIYTIFDIEATSADPETAEIVQLAALRPGQPPFMCYVATPEPISDDHVVWGITKIDPETYEREKISLEDALTTFLSYTAGTPLAGHNILRYDLPLLRRHLTTANLHLPEVAPPIDTLRWAHLLYPTPPADLKGYRLGDLYREFTGEDITAAHQADKDCEANREVLRHLYLNPPPETVLKVWQYLELQEASFYDVPPATNKELQALLETKADVAWLARSGARFPSPDTLTPEWLLALQPDELERVRDDVHPLNRERPRAQEEAREFMRVMGRYRPSQHDMLKEVTNTLEDSRSTLLEAPTGTGKTRGYLFPALHYVHHHENAKVVIATHTKVLQAQAYDELTRIADLGFQAKAVTVKSPRDYICLDALHDALADAHNATPDERVAQGVLTYYVQQGQFDLGAIPRHWDFSPAYRELRFNVQTNPRRCRSDCPFFNSCAFQTDKRQRDQASIWITNQAWLISHYVNRNDSDSPEDTLEELHLVIDEGHNLEDVATEAFAKGTSEEDTLFHLRRVFDQRRRRGWLRDNSKVPDNLKGLANEIRRTLVPNALEKLGMYTKHVVAFVKQYGTGEPQFGLSVAVGPKYKNRHEWAKLRAAETEWLEVAHALREALKALPRESWLGRNLHPTIDFFTQQRDMLFERRSALNELAADDDLPAYIHLSQWHTDSGWSHVAQPVDIAEHLGTLWGQASSVTITSATLSLNDDFRYITRVLGLENPSKMVLPGTLPYDRAHLVVPSHLPEARTSNLFRFQPLYHHELEALLPPAHRSLTLFTSTTRMKQAGEFLGKLPHLYVPLTRREREDVAESMKADGPASALGTRAYMEGVDFADLKLVNLERIPFPVPTALLQARQDMAERRGFDPWKDVYLPRALLTFVQAFGRLIRDDREKARAGAFVLWDKRLLSASYQLLFLASLPKGVNVHEADGRADFYRYLANVLEVNPDDLPSEELVDETQQYLMDLRASNKPIEEKVRELALRFWEVKRIKNEQWEAINASLAGRDAMVLLPTGYGKSLTFQIPAFLQGGLTLVVSPLIALMRDQVEVLQQKGLPAAALHSLISGAEQRSILDEVRVGRINLLYVSPERVNRSSELAYLLMELAEAGRLHRLVLDEAHCLASWGHDFRPDYLQVANKLEEIIPNLPVSALTATATPDVRTELRDNLKLNDPVEIGTSYDRPNLSYFTYRLNDIEKLRTIVQILNYVESHHKGDSVIIYTSSRKQTERLAWALRELRYQAEAYHAGLSGVIRNEVQENFMNGNVNVIIATNAFGMGIDKANVRAVVHFQPPTSLAAYIQEAGRAGRDGKPAFAVLMHNTSDWRTVEWLAASSKSDPEHANALLTVLLEQTHRPSMYARDVVALVNEKFTEDQKPLLAERFASLVNSLQEAEVLAFSYRIGKVFVLAENPESLEPHLETLRELGFAAKLEGDELDLSSLSSEQAEELSSFLYELRRNRSIRVYAAREAAIEFSLPTELHKAFTGMVNFSNRQRELRDKAVKRVTDMKAYALATSCKRDVLLQAFEQNAETCNTCGVCDTQLDEPTALSEPWQEEPPLDDELLESVYKPFDTLLEFLSSHRSRAFNLDGYLGLGQMKIVMALQGETERPIQSGRVVLGKNEVHNPFFGYLTFIRGREIERALARAAREQLVDITPFNDSSTYRINDAGNAYLAKRRRLRQRDDHERAA